MRPEMQKFKVVVIDEEKKKLALHHTLPDFILPG
jgi:hypothetical protein